MFPLGRHLLSIVKAQVGANPSWPIRSCRKNCDFCVSKKVKCKSSAEFPKACGKCVRNGVNCIWSIKQRPGPKVDKKNIAEPIRMPKALLAYLERRAEKMAALPAHERRGDLSTEEESAITDIMFSSDASANDEDVGQAGGGTSSGLLQPSKRAKGGATNAHQAGGSPALAPASLFRVGSPAGGGGGGGLPNTARLSTKDKGKGPLRRKKSATTDGASSAPSRKPRAPSPMGGMPMRGSPAASFGSSQLAAPPPMGGVIIGGGLAAAFGGQLAAPAQTGDTASAQGDAMVCRTFHQAHGHHSHAKNDTRGPAGESLAEDAAAALAASMAEAAAALAGETARAIDAAGPVPATSPHHRQPQPSLSPLPLFAAPTPFPLTPSEQLAEADYMSMLGSLAQEPVDDGGPDVPGSALGIDSPSAPATVPSAPVAGGGLAAGGVPPVESIAGPAASSAEVLQAVLDNEAPWEIPSGEAFDGDLLSLYVAPEGFTSAEWDAL